MRNGEFCLKNASSTQMEQKSLFLNEKKEFRLAAVMLIVCVYMCLCICLIYFVFVWYSFIKILLVYGFIGCLFIVVV